MIVSYTKRKQRSSFYFLAAVVALAGAATVALAGAAAVVLADAAAALALRDFLLGCTRLTRFLATVLVVSPVK